MPGHELILTSFKALTSQGHKFSAHVQNSH